MQTLTGQPRRFSSDQSVSFEIDFEPNIMAYHFKEFNSAAVFKLGSQQDLLSYSSDRPVGLFTFIWTGAESALLEIDREF